MKEESKNQMKNLFGETRNSLMETDPEFVNIMERFSEETEGVSRLTEKERMLCILSALLGCQGSGEYRNVLHEALNRGIPPVAVKEMIYQAAAYLGLGRIYDFLIVTNQVIDRKSVV